jgi:hypothetical protein
MSNAPAVVGVCEHYAEFVKLCRLRIEQLGITYDTVDEICGFPLRYTGKLLSEAKGMSVYALFTMARGLALLPVFQHDEVQHAKLKRHSSWMMMRRPGPRWRKKGRAHDQSAHRLYPDFLHKRAQAGGLAYRRKVKPKRRRELARNAAQARWSKNEKQNAVRARLSSGGHDDPQSV